MCKFQKRVYTDVRELDFKIEQILQDQESKLGIIEIFPEAITNLRDSTF